MEACEPPQRLVVRIKDEDEPDEGDIEVTLSADGDQTIVVWEERGMPLDLISAYAAGVQILGISYDDSKKQHDFAIHCAADFPFLSDDGKVAKLYDDEKAMVGFKYAGRRTVVVDKAGLIRFVYDGMPDNAKILADLKTLKK